MSPEFLQLLIAIVHVVLAAGATTHIVLTKDDVRAATGWVGLVWLTPVLGSALYVFLGVNRIRRRAGQLRRDRAMAGLSPTGSHALPQRGVEPALVPEGLRAMAALGGRVTGAPLTGGNDVEPLVDGDAAYPAMLAAIAGARRTVALATYIFDRGTVADRFVAALAAAVQRGVEVRVLIDGVGARYSRPPIVRALRQHGITVHEFLRSAFPFSHPYFNLRNHRKLMVVDGAVGFCGGLNIRDGCLLSLDPASPTQDVHFRFRGPVVRQMTSAFAFDWQFSSGEALAEDLWQPPPQPDAGSVLARGIPDGPDEDFEALLFTLLGAIAQARSRIRIVTPYFLPDKQLVDALKVAALRGVDVEILLPSRGNLRTVQWAQTAQLGHVLRGGCKVCLTPPPFDHSKLFTVDGQWALVGSANWDPRSLRLNFEYCVECYDSAFAARVDALIDAKRQRARPWTLGDQRRRALPLKLRDGLVWLAQPYL
ncbi:MAG: cardiolipin synthase [Gemmatimonadota bacterium]|nr:cardiolipin synthase [Gemmatimonadota bacterium]MDE3129367.1 cardiolipin synthase [Gemmatimonadota bacterium]MDE3174164.1 cardiolipin synthase [Gemmatimonadota bacterium]MDE3216436.1 cardiolipin synthase [Gemmatimonadota bacterium]